MSSPDDASRDSGRLTGVLERIVFFNEENHFTIGEMKPETGGPVVTVTGGLPGVQCGETLELTGVWTRNAKYGDQFKIASFRSKLPSSVYGIRKYLGGGLVPGVGKTYAEKIVAKFGTETLKVISEQSGRLREVEGIGPGRAKKIKQAWDEQVSLREVMIFLQTYGVGNAVCMRLIKNYGTLAGEILRTDPYRVAREIDGVGFRTADKIARNLGLPTEGAVRVDAGIEFVLGECEEEGHTAFPIESFVARSATTLEVTEDIVRARIDALGLQRRLVFCDTDGGRLVQLPAHDVAERAIAEAVTRIVSHPASMAPVKVDAAVVWAQEKAGFEFAPAQGEALRMALSNKFSIITGGPGTGKTTILRALVGIALAKKARVILAAPTGRAARRMSEAAGSFASTLHRLLKFDPEKGGFTHGANNPLNADLLVVDESSMLDDRLAAALLRAVHAHTRVVFVGDVNQLPSVGAGDVLRDLIASGRVAVTELTAVFRQGKRSAIVLTAHDILQGVPAMPTPVESATECDPSKDLFFIAAPDPERCVKVVSELCSKQIPRMFGVDPFADIQVLAPMHKGPAGIRVFNGALQAAMKPAGARGVSGHDGLRFEEGDKVIQVRNNYDKGVFNGDLGRVAGVNPESAGVVADFDGSPAEYDRADINELQLAYAVTVHKSQGSEFPVVVIPVLKSHFVMLRRNLIYTALTRGRRKVFLVGDPAAYSMAVRNADDTKRVTGLKFRLSLV